MLMASLEGGRGNVGNGGGGGGGSCWSEAGVTGVDPGVPEVSSGMMLGLNALKWLKLKSRIFYYAIFFQFF